jgi:hypothetical protein
VTAGFGNVYKTWIIVRLLIVLVFSYREVVEMGWLKKLLCWKRSRTSATPTMVDACVGTDSPVDACVGADSPLTFEVGTMTEGDEASGPPAVYSEGWEYHTPTPDYAQWCGNSEMYAYGDPNAACPQWDATYAYTQNTAEWFHSTTTW